MRTKDFYRPRLNGPLIHDPIDDLASHMIATDLSGRWGQRRELNTSAEGVTCYRRIDGSWY